MNGSIIFGLETPVGKVSVTIDADTIKTMKESVAKLPTKTENALVEQYGKTGKSWYKTAIKCVQGLRADKSFDLDAKCQWMCVKFTREFGEDEQDAVKDNISNLEELYSHYECSFRTIDFCQGDDSWVEIMMEEDSTCADGILMAYMLKQHFEDSGLENVAIKKLYSYTSEKPLSYWEESNEE